MIGRDLLQVNKTKIYRQEADKKEGPRFELHSQYKPTYNNKLDPFNPFEIHLNRSTNEKL